MGFTLVNESRFPTPYLKALANLVVETAEVKCGAYHITVKGRTRSWRGRGSYSRQVSCMNRHLGRAHGFWPYTVRDGRYRDSAYRTFKTRTELLVFLLGHEAAHSYYDWLRGYGHGLPVPKKGKDTEFLCNQRGMQCVEAYRSRHDEIWQSIRKALRVEHERALQRERTERGRVEAWRHPSHKLRVASDHLKEWEGRLRYARNKVRAYAKKVRYYERRLAATQAGPVEGQGG